MQMSKSYKQPYIKQKFKNGSKIMKRVASRAVKRYPDVVDGNFYKKVFESWNISDYNFYCPNIKKAYRK